MSSFCLPKQYTEVFRTALKSGTLKPSELRTMSSEQRRTLFSKILGEENARDTNILFEKNLLLKDQQTAMRNWANDLLGNNALERKSLEDKISRMENILNPETDEAFLADLAHKKLGTSLTPDEARRVFDLSKKAQETKAAMNGTEAGSAERLAYGDAVLELSETVNELKGKPSFNPRELASYGRFASQTAPQIINIPRSVLSSLDFSAPLIQLWGMTSTKRFWESLVPMFKYAASEKNYQKLNSYIVSHPDYDIAKKAGLRITDLGENVLNREDNYQFNLVENLIDSVSKSSKNKIGVPIPNPIRASGRAFTGAVNYVRFNRYVDLLNGARAAGEDVKVGSQASKDIANVVNIFTGSGNLGKADRLAHLSPLLNTVFFSSRNLSSVLNTFNPATYLKASPTARKAAMRQLLGSLAVTGAVLGLARASGYDVDMDPRSQNFGTFGTDEVRYDVTGGRAIMSRLLARLAVSQYNLWTDSDIPEMITRSGKEVKLGEKFGSPTGADLIIQFVRGKLSPQSSILADALYGKDPIGRPFNISDEMSNKLMPMSVQTFMDYSTSGEEGVVPLMLTMGSLFGMNARYAVQQERLGMTPWGDESGHADHEETDNLNDAMREIGYNPTFPPQTINGVKLTEDQYKEYIQVSGQFAKAQLLPLVSTPEWDNIPEVHRLSYIKSIINDARTKAQASIMIKNQQIFEGKR